MVEQRIHIRYDCLLKTRIVQFASTSPNFVAKWPGHLNAITNNSYGGLVYMLIYE